MRQDKTTKSEADQRVITYILRNNPVTSLELFERFGHEIYSRIHRLVREGRVIRSKYVDKGSPRIAYRVAVNVERAA